MAVEFRELRYVRKRVTDLDLSTQFAGDMFGLMVSEASDTEALLRADYRYYSLCLSTDLPDAIGFSVVNEEDLEDYAAHFQGRGLSTDWIDGEAAKRRLIKKGLSVMAPSGVLLEIVWRHMESGWPYHGPRHTGLNGFSAVQIAAETIAAEAAFWTAIPGLTVTDYAGEAVFLRLGGAHHQIAIYPSGKNGLLGAIWQVDTVDNVMRHWHHLQGHQVPIVHGPGRQATSKAAFVTAKAPDGFLMSYATEMSPPPPLGPRTFRDEPKSHCEWGSPCKVPEFKGDAA